MTPEITSALADLKLAEQQAAEASRAECEARNTVIKAQKKLQAGLTKFLAALPRQIVRDAVLDIDNIGLRRRDV